MCFCAIFDKIEMTSIDAKANNWDDDDFEDDDFEDALSDAFPEEGVDDVVTETGAGSLLDFKSTLNSLLVNNGMARRNESSANVRRSFGLLLCENNKLLLKQSVNETGSPATFITGPGFAGENGKDVAIRTTCLECGLKASEIVISPYLPSVMYYRKVDNGSIYKTVQVFELWIAFLDRLSNKESQVKYSETQVNKFTYEEALEVLSMEERQLVMDAASLIYRAKNFDLLDDVISPSADFFGYRRTDSLMTNYLEHIEESPLNSESGSIIINEDEDIDGEGDNERDDKEAVDNEQQDDIEDTGSIVIHDDTDSTHDEDETGSIIVHEDETNGDGHQENGTGNSIAQDNYIPRTRLPQLRNKWCRVFRPSTGYKLIRTSSAPPNIR